MKNVWRRRAAFAAVVPLLSAVALADKKSDDKKPEPFFHQFLIPGDPLDEKLLEQEKKVAENPNSAPLLNDFGNLLAERRFPKEARQEYKKALKADPHFFLAAYNLGLMEETEGNISQAVSAYREAIDRRRGFPPAHFRLGRLYEKQGRDDAAIEEYAKAIRIDDALRDPKVNPLIIDSRLIDQASLVNYPRDVARTTLRQQDNYVDVAKFRPVPVDRSLDAAEVVEEAGPQTIQTGRTAPPAGNRAPAPSARPGRPDASARPAGRPMARP
ncbi:MAG TPA: tetratricopeptide repeat protein, partial [Thermoanaerobaculia bacterium]|nr:tetratricopeptide repeat protein [Thermoanaerobaculia bacterium]